MHYPPESQFQHKKKRQNNQHHQQYQQQTQAPWTPPNQPLQPPSPWMVPPTTWPPQMPQQPPLMTPMPQQLPPTRNPERLVHVTVVVSLVFPDLLAQLIMLSVLIAVHGVILRQFVGQTQAHHLHNNQIKQIQIFLARDTRLSF